MKNHFVQRISTFVAILLIGCLSSICAADTIVFTNATGDWNDPVNWSNLTTPANSGALPTTSDIAIINNNNVSNVSSVIGTEAGAITVSNTTNPLLPGTLNVTGGSLSYSGALNIAPAAGGVGTLNISGGSLTSTATVNNVALGGGSGGTLNLSGGTFTSLGTAPADVSFINGVTLNLSGGTLDFTGGQVVPGGNATFNVIGDGATILTDRFNSNTAGRATTLNFDFDSDGISSFVSTSFVNLQNATINVDGSAYTGGAGTFNLFESGNLASSPASQNITGAFAGFDADFSEVNNNLVLTLTTAVPEPTSLVLLTGGLMGFCLRRRR